MSNLLLFSVIILIVFLCMLLTMNEKFSSSGLTISDDYCRKMADVYYKPKDMSLKNRDLYNKLICDDVRRELIEDKTGNYFTVNGVLV